MAEGPWKVFQSFQEAAHMSQDFSVTLAMGLVKSTYVPATSHSAWSQVVANAASASKTFTNHVMTSVDWTLTGSATKLTMANHNFTSGDGLTCQYAVLFQQTSGRLIAIAALSSADVVANQINVTLGTVLQLRDSNGI